jgi:DNA segregation ATPase FtsK/SpoIIIE-like protein
MDRLIKLYLQHRKLSVSFIQRKLRVQEKEAAKLLLEFNLRLDTRLKEISSFDSNSY